MGHRDADVLEERDGFRVLIERDDYPDEPYDDGQSPLLRLNRYRGHDGVQAEHVMATGRPTDDDNAIEYAIRHWSATPASDDWRLFEKYLRAFFGPRQIQTWYSGDYWYVTYDTARWREYAGMAEYTGEPGNLIDMSEWRAYCEGDVYGYIVQKLVHWTADDGDFEDEDRWEDTEDSCWGFYGYGKYLEDTAREALQNAIEANRKPDRPLSWPLSLRGGLRPYLFAEAYFRVPSRPRTLQLGFSLLFRKSPFYEGRRFSVRALVIREHFRPARRERKN